MLVSSVRLSQLTEQTVFSRLTGFDSFRVTYSASFSGIEV